MTPFFRFSCHRDELPSIEAVLAAQGYVVENPSQRTFGRDSILVMSSGETIVLLAHSEPSETAAIEIWGAAGMATVELLKSLPLSLTLQRVSASGEWWHSGFGLGAGMGDLSLQV